MAGDIEEFLRRAAERRQQRTQQQQRAQQRGAPPSQQQTPRPPAPQYTDRAAERVPRAFPEPPPEPLMAEIIEDDAELSLSDMRKAREADDQSKIDRQLERHTSSEPSSGGSGSTAGPPASAAADLIRMLRNPNGIKQAILLREILEPRSNLWD